LDPKISEKPFGSVVDVKPDRTAEIGAVLEIVDDQGRLFLRVNE
jgi:hypothetical protein